MAVSFREQSLLQIFRISLTSLSQLKIDGNILFNILCHYVVTSVLTHTCTYIFLHFCFTYLICIFFNISYAAFFVYAVGNNLQQLAVSLALKCLTYDFMGTSIDESSEDFGSIQVYFCSPSVDCFSFPVLFYIDILLGWAFRSHLLGSKL